LISKQSIKAFKSKKLLKTAVRPPMHHGQRQYLLAIVWLRGKNRRGELLITGAVDSSTKMMMEVRLTEKDGM
jgi:hypothetical protein